LADQQKPLTLRGRAAGVPALQIKPRTG